ncbi:MAG: DUF58 domain-containing protein [Solirubrobacterales bacterium]
MARDSGRLHVGLTDAGKVVLRGVAFVALACLVVPAFGVLAILLAVCLMAVVVGYIMRPRVQVTGNLPERVIAGQTAYLSYSVKNVGRMSAYNLSVRFLALPGTITQAGDAEMVARLAPGETAEVAITIQPKRRGNYPIGQPICETSFPFNLFRIGVAYSHPETLLVLPTFSWLRIPLQYVSRHVNTSQLRPAGRAGGSPEYIGSRPFQSGDSPKRIDVRAWARLGSPATKEYDDDLDDYAAIVLDTRVSEGWGKSKSGEIKELEAAVNLCASVAYTIHQDCMIAMLLAGPDLHEFATSPKPRRLARVHETLAGVNSSTGYSLDQIGPLLEDRLPEISEIIFVVLRWDEMYQRLVQWAQRAGCHTTVVVIGEPSAAAPADDWLGNVQFIPAEEILAGRVEQL